MTKTRCAWVDPQDELYASYHDEVWGTPVRDDDRMLFEMLSLEGAQAGLSWRTILARLEGYREVFNNFDIDWCAEREGPEIEEMLQNPKIIRNRRKVESVINNAKIFKQIQDDYGSFSNYLWAFVDNEVINNHPKTHDEVPAQTELSEKIAKDFKKKGITFMGPTTTYAYMQAIGVVNDHTVECFKAAE